MEESSFIRFQSRSKTSYFEVQGPNLKFEKIQGHWSFLPIYLSQLLQVKMITKFGIKNTKGYFGDKGKLCDVI